MITLKRDELVFTFPEVSPDAHLTLEFQRTLRIPDDGKEYPLPPGLGRFPMRHVDDCADRIPEPWREHGGVMLPMYQSEALWINFDGRSVANRDTRYPFAVKIATGKICAVSGKSWQNRIQRSPQDYLVVPSQPWLDGYVVKKGRIRQFVAMPLGSGYTAEEQITESAEHGGLQIVVYPMKREVFEKRFPIVERTRSSLMYALGDMSDRPRTARGDGAMGLAPGGEMRQKIYRDRFDLNDWDQEATSRCFVHIANSLVWRDITGEEPPSTPVTAKEYSRAGLPWFDYYSDQKAVKGSKVLSKLKSIAQMGTEKDDVPLPENESVKPEKVVVLREGMKRGQVREGSF